jgi:HEAT repeat protein
MSFTFLSSLTRAEDTPNTTASQNKHSQEARIIQFTNELLTVNVRDMALTELLQEIERQSGLNIMSYKSLEERITMQFHQLSMDVGLRRILRQQNFAMAYAQQIEEGKSTVRRPRKLWIFPGGENGYPIHTMLVEDTEQGVGENDLGSLEDIGVDNSVEALTLALSNEKSEELRQEIILNMGWIGDERAIEPLARVLREDQNSEVRESAIIALMQIGGDGIIDPIIKAKTDKDSTVRELAVIALAEVEGEQESETLMQIESDVVIDPIINTKTDRDSTVKKLAIP